MEPTNDNQEVTQKPDFAAYLESHLSDYSKKEFAEQGLELDENVIPLLHEGTFTKLFIDDDEGREILDYVVHNNPALLFATTGGTLSTPVVVMARYPNQMWGSDGKQEEEVVSIMNDLLSSEDVDESLIELFNHGAMNLFGVDKETGAMLRAAFIDVAERSPDSLVEDVDLFVRLSSSCDFIIFRTVIENCSSAVLKTVNDHIKSQISSLKGNTSYHGKNAYQSFLKLQGVMLDVLVASFDVGEDADSIGSKTSTGVDQTLNA